jgi:hypothetical protein
MPHTVTLLDRLRIERLVWALDQRLYDLPYRRRTDCRREVRQNTLAAAQESGITEALRGVGSAGELAREYLSAEYGNRLRPHWTTAAVVLLLIVVLIMFVIGQENTVSEAAILAVDPHATGTFTVPGITFLQRATVFTYSNGQTASPLGGDYTPLFYVLWAVAVIVAGRLWRVRFSRRSAQDRPKAFT